ncbi:hypothetical protein [Nocardioides sp. zg-1228]|uniref:hypothetical protein n=1 Tax=Nocardioides sp. zg-1228 TaxID=2763008 RepID=UPI00164303B0|nr:hypothetical protein [Nocardioides sp. zg-1228]MBC2934256.1 hypothetical protein [Nocardioides sp. zg-1228]QSF59036.1 hypothetical protein JX575_07675 [Nocardioides sp. zg-1228]
MEASGRQLDPGRHEQLAALLDDVLVARRTLDQSRHATRLGEQQQLRQALLDALEAYAAALAAAGAPLPPRLRSEIDLYKGLRGRM